MLKKVTVDLDKLEEEEIEALKALITKAKPITSQEPSYGQSYFSIEDGRIDRHIWVGDNVDEKRYAALEAFIDENDALKELRYRKVHRELLDFAKSHNQKTGWDGPKYIIIYNGDKVNVYSTWEKIHPHTIYFNSQEVAKAAIDYIGEERLINYYFGEDKND